MSNNEKDKDFAPINVELSDRIPMAGQRQSTSAKSANVAANSNKPLLIFVLVLTLLACGASAYLFNLHNNNLKIIAAAENRIESLENRLNATGEEMGNSTVALQVKVTELSNKTQELWEQMDKLWASAWRRNQQEIKSVEAGLNAFQKDTNTQIKALETKIASTSSSIQQLQNRIDGVNNNVNNKVSGQANDLLALNVNQEELQSSLLKQNTELRAITEKLILLEQRNTGLLQKLQQLEAKLTEVANKGV